MRYHGRLSGRCHGRLSGRCHGRLSGRCCCFYCRSLGGAITAGDVCSPEQADIKKINDIEKTTKRFIGSPYIG